YNQIACSSKAEEWSATAVITPIRSVRGGSTFAKGGKTCARDIYKGAKTSARGGKTLTESSRGGQASTLQVSSPSSPFVGFKMSPNHAVITTGSDIMIRGGVYIRGGSQPGNSPTMALTRSATNETERIRLRIVNGKVIRSRGRGDGSRLRM
ncbi:hypothetical protein Tco_0254327, partial [Tanacetum coccineum]